MPAPRTNPYDTYTSPLATRNASPEMLRIWSPRHKFQTWRRIWLAVAEAQKECGLEIADEQIAELRAAVERGISDDEIQSAEQYERDLRHDVMAHVHALGDSCPKARPIIHLGMTSQDAVCNADLIRLDAGLDLLRAKAARAVLTLAEQANRRRDLPTLGSTHGQPAQPTTVGRRLAGWAYDLAIAEQALTRAHEDSKFRGFRGATGTQASFMALFDGDSRAVDRFEQLALQNLSGCDCSSMTHVLTGQTYPRVFDAIVLAALASVAAVLHKIATDIRLLCVRKELDEPFGSSQVGSSAMPYKRNPMRCERICGLSRFVMNLVGNAYDTAATQWLERTLDDSSNRRLSLPEAFLALDGALDLMHNVASGLVVHEAMVRRNLMAEMPFLVTENILMAAVKAGGDRQDLHEKIRVHAQAAGARVKDEGLDNDLIQRLRNDPALQSKARGGALERDLDWNDDGGLLDPMNYVGRAPQQVDRFIAEIVEPLREQYAEQIEALGDSEPSV